MSYLRRMLAASVTPPSGPEQAPDGLPMSVDEWPVLWQQAFEERAAIMEFDGGLSRLEAERRAAECIRAECQRIEALLREVGDAVSTS